MKVSILIPAYNVENYITKCLESVCRQTHEDLQIVVIDDGSKDSTPQILWQWAEKDKRIEFFSRENKGVAQTRNELLDHAKGDYILFVDSDDWIEPEMVATLVDISERNSVNLVMCQNVHNKRNENIGNEISLWKKDTILNKFLEHRILTGALWNKLIKREIIGGLRFNPEIGYGEDALIMWNILNRIEEMAFTTNQFYHYRPNATSISSQGLSDSKMSVIPVWEYISNSELAKTHNLTDKAKARYGAEISLLLFEAINNNEGNHKVAILRKKLKQLYPYILKEKSLSYKFKLFSLISILNWTISKAIFSFTK